MADDNEPVQSPDEAMDRIDAALDRIAARPLNSGVFSSLERTQGSPGDTDANTAIIAARLDGLITRLREALAFAAG